MESDPESPHVTVVVPTHRRPEGLKRVLRGLAQQQDVTVAWDVVVVDNDVEPGTAADSAVEELERLPVPARVVVEARLGASNARNRGIAEATGSIVAFIDDDVVPDIDWLARVVEPVLAGRCDGVGGRVELDPLVPLPRWMPAWMRGYLSYFRPSEHEVDLQCLTPKPLNEAYLLTANAAFTADVLARCGGLDPVLGPREGVPLVNDDVSLCRRVIAAGGTIRFTPAACVTHDLPASRLRRRYLLRRLYAQGRSDWLLDRDFYGPMKSAGLRAAVSYYFWDLVSAWRHESLEPRHTFVWAHGAWRAGLGREAAVHLVRRGRSGRS